MGAVTAGNCPKAARASSENVTSVAKRNIIRYLATVTQKRFL